MVISYRTTYIKFPITLKDNITIKKIDIIKRITFKINDQLICVDKLFIIDSMIDFIK